MQLWSEMDSSWVSHTLLMVSGTMTIADLEKVSVRMGATQILRDITLSIGPGDAIGLFGSNGAGKTTLLRLLATLILPVAGTATVLGVDPAGDGRYDVRSRIGFVGHMTGLYPELTLAENLSFVASARGIDLAEVDRCLAVVGLAGVADRRAEVCSHGMQRRAEFARILMTEPDLLLLDEPHSALDGDAVGLVDALVRRTLDGGGAAVLASHDRDRVAKLATDCREISGGTLV
ncbi:MAG: heme ABC exporter ATP-binding protein CcmA [Acidimicrobiia bacterium]|nr:MAG: heme ABC exporter ATP-binding protein CcmA [Acidimicrobiia bacterium]